MITGTEHLSLISLITGGLLLVLGLFSAFRGDAFYSALKAFPRNRVVGIILIAIGLIWAALMIDQMTLGELSRFKWLLYILTPLSFFLIITYLDELLAPRALGGLLMLAPVLMTDSARWHPSPWRYTVIILAYIMVIKGAWLMLCPFKFRIWTDAIFANQGRRRIAAFALIISAALLFITGIKAG